MSMLSYEEALDFATNTLKVSITDKEEAQLDTLNKLIKAYFTVIPFQSLTLQCVPLEERRKPSLHEIKTQVLSQHGGLCYTLNTFMKYFLEALGYTVYHITSTKRNPNDHILNIAIITGARYLVDVGNGYPTFEAIPIDFERESTIYQHSFLEYKFVKKSKDELVRLHRKGESFRSDINNVADSSCWKEVCNIDLTPRDIVYFDENMSKMYSSPDHMLFHTSLRIVQFIDGYALVIREGELLQEDKDTHMLVCKEKLKTRKDILEKIKLLFPNLLPVATELNLL